MFFVIAKIIQLNVHFFKKITGNNIKLRIVNAEKEKKTLHEVLHFKSSHGPS